jgi:2-haloacid dehalogenase
MSSVSCRRSSFWPSQHLYTDSLTRDSQDWDKQVEVLVKAGKAAGHVDWVAIDDYRITILIRKLTDLGLFVPSPSDPSHPGSGSLFTLTQLTALAKVWHRLPPWPDTVPGLTLLDQHFITATLSNTYQAMMESLVAHSSLPFQHVFTSELWDSYKPAPKVYLGAVERLGVRPEECALVAAHLGDLKGAKACGLRTFYVEREAEEKEPQLRETGIEELRVSLEDGKGGFVRLAELLQGE